MTDMFASANALSDANKGYIHSSFSPNSNWPYDWSAFVVKTAPVFTSSPTAFVRENETSALDANATDANGDALSFTLTGGEDGEQFSINAATGLLSFRSAPDF